MKKVFLVLGILVGSVLFILFVSIFLIRSSFSPAIRAIVEPLGVCMPEIVGFQPYWLVGTGKQSYAKDVTTLTYFSLALEPDGTIRKEDKPGESEPGWAMLTSDTYEATLSAHRKAGTKLSLLVQNMVEEDIMALIATPEAHATTLVSEVAPLMKKHGFTDLNLDIESFNKASESARMGFVQFVRAVKDELTRLELGTLTVELTPKTPVELHLIDPARIGEIADYLVLMAYDYHYVFSSVAGPVAPVGGVPTTTEYDVETALKETLRYVPASKVILGVPLYGYEWETLRSSPGAAVIPGSWQVATGRRMEEFIKTCTDCTRGFDPVSLEPYVIFPGETPGHFQQVFYEDEEALRAKIALAEKYNIAGLAMWAVGYESEGMLAPLSMYRNSVQYHGFGHKPSVPYTQIQPASYVLMPPTHALVGSIATMSGEVKKLGRQDEEYQPLDTPGPLVQGESVATGGDGALTIQFPNIATIDMGPMSELSLSGLLSPNMFLRQKGGVISYRLIQGDMPLSVRVLGSLVELASGDMDVTVDGSQGIVTLKRGSAKIGNIDKENVTATYGLTQGQTARLDESDRTVVIN